MAMTVGTSRPLVPQTDDGPLRKNNYNIIEGSPQERRSTAPEIDKNGGEPLRMPMDTQADEAAPVGIHPYAIGTALAAAIWFVIAMAISFSGTLESDYLIAVTVGFSVIFFWLLLSTAMRAADYACRALPRFSFRRFLAGEVPINTGKVSGREALVQILVLPITLAIGATVIGTVFVLGI
jgi:hypothetical protein